MNYNESLSFDKEICFHLAEDRERHLGSVVPPIYQNNVFLYKTHESISQAENDLAKHYIYSRGANPTVEIAERKLAALERGEACRCFSSGMAAISSILLSSLKSGDHVLCVSNIYFSTIDFLKYMDKFGVEHSIIYSTSPDDIEKEIRANTRVIYIESPTDMNFRIIDLRAVAKLAKAMNIRTIIDNSWATPLYQKPLTMGMDVVVHSASKYLGGHSDLLGGAVIASKEIIDQVFSKELIMMGAVMGPHEASLLIRGLRTLPFRMKEHQENALKIASFLESHPAVEKVNYPGLPSHPDYQLSKEQMTGYTGLMSFQLKQGTYEAVRDVINKMKLFKIGVSWGSFESLIWSPNLGNNAVELKKQHINPGLIRIAVGLEDAEDLIGDLDYALN
ncbi:aminotransferase class I/II-fold pyridoxal phosphate-dependent enzyme [Peribacillus saganii]|uniref:homocysteine desulfhydrase n=1 Tax=Peribacillus saganii TaxID=2303992 RepID=A0A372LFW2_9BACI|nr:aminotransferase class I/II-fold pyridoxal phosphate-dependent enzyme [Peribacillus saganii]RFU64435.1 aminotransferase class I/II-fold pyridoxal phosphate-dependent enzyme [Peribacillus saganii]